MARPRLVEWAQRVAAARWIVEFEYIALMRFDSDASIHICSELYRGSQARDSESLAHTVSLKRLGMYEAT